MGWTKTRSQIAHAKRRDPDADVSELQCQLRAERLADHIADVVNAAPGLDQETRERLALLLRGGGDAA